MDGKIHIYCGDGKGKTTAAIGLAMRCAGSGKKVMFLQFFKDGTDAEIKSLGRIPNISVVFQFKTFGPIWKLTEAKQAEARVYYSGLLERAFEYADDYDMLILDEVTSALSAGLIDERRLLHLLEFRPEGLEVVLTGRDPSSTLVVRADYVTEMNKIKHPADKGEKPRRGIEF